MSITHRAGDLFEIQLPNQIIVHLVSAQGVWGCGFAKQLKTIVPRSFKDFSEWFMNNEVTPGSYRYHDESRVLSICTTRKYGRYKDTPQQQLDALIHALRCFHFDYNNTRHEFISPRIGAGCFEINWRDTQEVIEKFIEVTGHKWTVVHQ